MAQKSARPTVDPDAAIFAYLFMINFVRAAAAHQQLARRVTCLDWTPGRRLTQPRMSQTRETAAGGKRTPLPACSRRSGHGDGKGRMGVYEGTAPSSH